MTWTQHATNNAPSVAKNKQTGFTIVELLIVIVVIGILAAITVVAYSGIQTRAHNSKTVATIDQYLNILEIYKVNNGHYPRVNAEHACLPTDLPATSEFGEGVCAMMTGSVVGGTITPDGLDFIGMLESTQATLPDAGYGRTITDFYSFFDGERARGPTYSDDGGPAVYYHLVDAASCPIGNPNETGLPSTLCVVRLD